MAGNIDMIANEEKASRGGSLSDSSQLYIQQRVREKKRSYEDYNFKRHQEEALSTFFDLAQEFTSIDHFYQICVAVPKEFLNIESRLHVFEQKSSKLVLVCTSLEGLLPENQRSDCTLEVKESPYETQESLIYPIPGNEALTRSVPFLTRSSMLGLFEICPKGNLKPNERLFLEKFSNRIGFQLHQKLLIQQNIDHLKFINQLLSDIEHNVINPNMHYKLFLIRFRKGLQAHRALESEFEDILFREKGSIHPLESRLTDLKSRMARNTATMEKEWSAFSKHYEHTSLFLETLLRKDHFEKGTYVLRRQTCNFLKEIVEPLLDRYIATFRKRNIAVDNLLEGVPDDQMTLYVDKGLISQVFDNIFSNAIKYTQEVEDQLGNRIKIFSCNRKILKNFFSEGTHGLRFSFFTTGKPLNEEEAQKIFEGGYRALSSIHERGTGHGLNFVKNVVEVHGGILGCEPQKYGNLIYFVLPLK